MVAVRRPLGLTDDLTRLATALEDLDLPGPGALGEEASRVRDRLVSVIRSYLIPRVDNPEEPFLVVVAGPTGSGKSTLVNTLAGLDISRTGAVRPTTTVPLVLTRTGRHEAGMSVGGVRCQVTMGSAPILDHMSLIDTPDIDSTSVDHRVVAEQLIDHADIVVFVTSALRYADDVPWEVLRRALSRGTSVIPVLNRVGPESAAALAGFRALLVGAGIDQAPVRVPEHHLGPGAQQIPSLAIRDLRRRLFMVARERERFHREVVNRVINATVVQAGDLVETVRALAARFEEMAEKVRRLLSEADTLGGVDLSWAEELPPAGRPPSRLPRARRRELTTWKAGARAAIIAGVETRLREAVATAGAELICARAITTNALASGAGSMVAAAVDDWLGSIDEMASGHRDPGTAVVAFVAGAMSPWDEGPARLVLGEGADRLPEVRLMLEARVGVVFAHHAERLVEALLRLTGEPDPDEVERRLKAVLAAYQFADA